MNTLVHADIFFFVTTIAVVVVAAALAIALMYLVRILNDVKKIAEQVREELVVLLAWPARAGDEGLLPPQEVALR